MSAWSPQIKECHRIFFRATSGNRTLLFAGKDAPLDRSDPRLRSIPFPTKRATFHEVKRVHEVLSAVQMHGDSRTYAEDVKKLKEQSKSARVARSGGGSPSKHGKIRRSKSREPVNRQLPEEVQHLIKSSSSSSEDESESLNFESFVSSTKHLMEFDGSKSRHTRTHQKREADDEDDKSLVASRLITACKSDNVADMSAILDSHPYALNQQHGNSKLTLLHLAAADGKRGVIKLLLKKGADPCLKDRSKKVPYQLCLDKETRKVFMTFRGENPEAHNYTVAMIPPPASAEAEARQKEKKARQRQAKKEKARAAKEEEKVLKKEKEEKERYLKLSDREKRALAAEKRILTSGEQQQSVVLSRCFQCAKDITGKVPFEYSNLVFCSPVCVRNHRQKNATK